MHESWSEVANEVLQENTAQSIHQQLEQLDNQKDRYSRRWIWELFQNALDAVPEGQLAEITIGHQGNRFSFSHNGAPFQQKEILHLIFHGSTKREREGVIGRYGTGFLSTHVLSRKVRISGSLNTGDQFDFVLDRTGTTPSEIAKSMARSFDSLKESIKTANSLSNSRTTFDYTLEGPAEDYVRGALEDLRTIAPMVLAFNPAIGKVEVVAGDNRSLTVGAKHSAPHLGNACLIEIGGAKEGEAEWRCCLIDDTDISIAIPLRGTGSTQRVAIPATLPRLFVAFPLFGTEDLPLPFILNCPGKPTEKRDGLFLGQEQTEDNLRNKAYIERGWRLFAGVLEQAANLQWGDLFELARMGPVSSREWLDTNWFNNLAKSNLVRHVLGAPLVQTEQTIPVTPLQGVFPIAPTSMPSHEFLSLVRPIYGGHLVPINEVASQWIDVLNQWSGLASHADIKINTVGLTELGKRISGCTTLASLQAVLQLENPASVQWLNSVFAAIIASGNQDILDKERVLPDQNGMFQLRSHLKRDLNIDEELKGISKELGNDVRAELLLAGASSLVQELLPAVTSDTVSTSLLSRIVSKTKTEYGTPSYRRANSALFAWFASARRIDSLKSFPFISAEKDQSGNERPIGTRDHLLGPVNVWPTTARPFADLFPQAYIASALYAGVIDQDTWEWLRDQGLFLLDPVIRHFQDVDGDDLVGLLEQPFPREEEDLEHKIRSMEVIDLTHLTLKDKGVIDGVRSSKSKCVEFLEFVLRHVLPTNSDSLDYQVKECSCSRKHSIHSAMWISVLRNRQWVFERKGHAGRPTSANLAKVWKESADLMHSIATTDVILFLRRLEVNASEIQRGASSMPESDSLKMEKAMVALLAATNNDVGSLQILADITASEPGLFNEYKDRLKQRERVRLNQKVGASIEELFKIVFKDPQLLKLGLRISRTGWGSDFCIEHDLVDENGEVAFELQTDHGSKFLIELKSTTGTTVSMSEMQGSEAVMRHDSFALCVVPIDEDAMGPEGLRTRARFVPNIGLLLNQAVAELEKLRAVETQAAISGADVDVLLQESEVVYRVKEAVWERGLDFDHFIEFLLQFFGSRSRGISSEEHRSQE